MSDQWVVFETKPQNLPQEVPLMIAGILIETNTFGVKISSPYFATSLECKGWTRKRVNLNSKFQELNAIIYPHSSITSEIYVLKELPQELVEAIENK
jgi:hypothetical protein